MNRYVLFCLFGLLVIAVCVCTPLFVKHDRDHYNSYLHGECTKIANHTNVKLIPRIDNCHCTGCTGALCSDIANVTGHIKCCGDSCRNRYGATIVEECELYNLVVISGTQTYMDGEYRNFTLELNCIVGEKSCITADAVECWTKDDELRFVEPHESVILLIILCLLYTFLFMVFCAICLMKYGERMGKYCHCCDDEIIG